VVTELALAQDETAKTPVKKKIESYAKGWILTELYDRRDNRHEDDVSGGEGGVVGETIFVEEHDFEEKTHIKKVDSHYLNEHI
jgi:hypothetical protein